MATMKQISDAVAAIAAGAAARDAGKADMGSASACLMAYGFACYIDGTAGTDTMKESLKTLPGWDKAKGAWSGAVNFAAWLKAGNRLPAEKEKPFILAGHRVSMVTAADLDTLAMPPGQRQEAGEDAPRETTLPVMVNRWRVVKRERENKAQEAAERQAACIGAYLASPEASPEHSEHDAASLAAMLADDLPALHAIVVAGAAILAAQEAAAKADAEAGNVRAVMLATLDAIKAGEVSAEDMASLAAAIAERQAATLAATLDSDAAPARKVA